MGPNPCSVLNPLIFKKTLPVQLRNYRGLVMDIAHTQQSDPAPEGICFHSFPVGRPRYGGGDGHMWFLEHISCRNRKLGREGEGRGEEEEDGGERRREGRQRERKREEGREGRQRQLLKGLILALNSKRTQSMVTAKCGKRSIRKRPQCIYSQKV